MSPLELSSAPDYPYPVDTTVSFNARFVDSPSGNYWNYVPRDVREFLSKPEGTMYGIMENIIPNRNYRITISIERINDFPTSVNNATGTALPYTNSLP